MAYSTMNYSILKYSRKQLTIKEQMVQAMNIQITAAFDAHLLEELRSYKWDSKK